MAGGVRGALARMPRWPAWVAVVFALPYPVLRTIWALGGTVGTTGGPLDVPAWLAWGVAVAGMLLVALAVVLLVAHGPAWFRAPVGWGGAALGLVLAFVGTSGTAMAIGAAAAGRTVQAVGNSGLAWWVFVVVYASWAVAGLGLVASGLRCWAVRRNVRDADAVCAGAAEGLSVVARRVRT